MADANAQLCMPRCEGKCTAFHLDSIVKDNNEVLVRVYYDWSPTPATTLDLRIQYSRADLTLVDARPTKPLADRGKELSTKQNDAGFMRLVVIGKANTLPIPYGPIAELLFTRTSAMGSAISAQATVTASAMLTVRSTMSTLAGCVTS